MSVGAVVTCCALATACSPDQAPANTPTPTLVATTPAESQIERQMQTRLTRRPRRRIEPAWRSRIVNHKLGIAMKTEELTLERQRQAT